MLQDIFAFSGQIHQHHGVKMELILVLKDSTVAKESNNQSYVLLEHILLMKGLCLLMNANSVELVIIANMVLLNLKNVLLVIIVLLVLKNPQIAQLQDTILIS